MRYVNILQTGLNRHSGAKRIRGTVPGNRSETVAGLSISFQNEEVPARALRMPGGREAGLSRTNDTRIQRLLGGNGHI